MKKPNPTETNDTARRTMETDADAGTIKELRLLLQELRLKTEAKEERKTTNPMILAILAGTGTALLAVLNSFASWYSAHSLDQSKFERELIGDALKAADPDSRRTNFTFLLDSGLVADPAGRLRRTFTAIPVAQTPLFPSDTSDSPIPSVEVGLPHEVDTGGFDDFTVRAGPGVTYPVVARLPSGTQVTPTAPPVLAGSAAWVPVQTADNLNGWISVMLLRPAKKPTSNDK